MKLDKLDGAQALRHIDQNIACAKWASIFKKNLDVDSSTLSWKNNMAALHKNTLKAYPDTAIWSESYGLWPGQTLAIFAAHSRWIHLSTNTLPFYNVFPRLEGQFPALITTHADGLEGPMTHWMHEDPNGDSW